MTANPRPSAATCLLCDPPEVVGAALMDHLRLFHPGYHDSLTSAGGAVSEPDPAPGALFTAPMITEADLRPDGMRCEDCDHLFAAGDRYAPRLHGLTSDGIQVTGVVCLDCEDTGRAAV